MGRFENYLLLNKMSKQNLTTVFHELATGIYLLDNKAGLSEPKDILKYIESEKVIVYGMTYNDILEKYKLYWETDDIKTFESSRNDAKNLAKEIYTYILRSKNPDKILWTGPTNDGTDYGAADIVAINGTKEVPISLKKDIGQLKNLGLKSTGDILLKGIIDNNESFIDSVMSSDLIKYWNEMTGKWLEFIEKNNNVNKKEVTDIITKYKNKNLTWNNYQKIIITDEEVEVIEKYKKVPKYHFLKDVLGGLYQYKKGSDWGKAKLYYFDKIFNNFFKNHEETINKNLKNYFKAQMSLSNKGISIWYVAEGGKKLMLLPSSDIFDKASGDFLEFKLDSKSTEGGYYLNVYVTGKYVRKSHKIMSIKVNIRWIKKQMVNKPSTTSSMKLDVDPKVWNEIFRLFV